MSEETPTLSSVIEENKRLHERILELERLAALQAEEIKIMKLRRYGRRSEKIPYEDSRQGLLFDEAELYSVGPDDPPEYETVRIRKTVYTRQKRGRKPLSPKLSRIDLVIDLPEPDKKTFEGFELVRIGEETSEQVHEIPRKYVVIRTIRPKYVVRRIDNSILDTESEIRISPLPPRILPRSIATPSLLASVITGKFCDGLPFYRQERMFARHGLDISRQDMSNWSIAVAKKLEPLEILLRSELLKSPYLHCDETFFQVMNEPGKSNSTKSYMWVTEGGIENKRIVLYQYSRTRSSEFISSFLDLYSGYLQTDGYDGYNAIGEKKGIVHVGCWAHARRKFVEAHEVSGKEGSADEMISMIGELYDIEKRLRQRFLQKDGSGNIDEFLEYRKKETSRVFVKIEEWLSMKSSKVPPQMLLGKAISYTKGQWERLVRYVECPYLTPDNNPAERAIRPFTVGRKNWYFSGGPKGAQASATLYSFIESAKACGLEPYYFIRYILTKLPFIDNAKIESLLPWNVNPCVFGELTKEDARISLDSIPVF